MAMLSEGTIFIYGLLVMAIFIGLFFLLRSVTLWYFKIDTMIDLLKEQINNQRLILKHLKGEPGEEEKKQ